MTDLTEIDGGSLLIEAEVVETLQEDNMVLVLISQTVLGQADLSIHHVKMARQTELGKTLTFPPLLAISV